MLASKLGAIILHAWKPFSRYTNFVCCCYRCFCYGLKHFANQCCLFIVSQITMIVIILSTSSFPFSNAGALIFHFANSCWNSVTPISYPYEAAVFSAKLAKYGFRSSNGGIFKTMCNWTSLCENRRSAFFEDDRVWRAAEKSFLFELKDILRFLIYWVGI